MRFDIPADDEVSESIQSWRALEDICEAIRLAHSDQLRIEWAIDRERRLREVRGIPKNALYASSALLSLKYCLARLSSFSEKKRLYREKCILSIVLAHSMLQLHESPWLAREWNAESILFLEEPSMSTPDSSSFGCFLRKPYVSTSLHVANTEPHAPLTVPEPRPRSHQKSCLLALAVILLELYLNRSITADIADVGDIRGALIDLAYDCYHNLTMTENYYYAIVFCINPTPDPVSRMASFDEPGFREIYYEKVIFLLEEDLKDKYEMDWRTLCDTF